MTIRREDLDTLDFSAVAEPGAELLPPTHPGEILRQTIEELDISQYRLAKDIGVSAMRISHVANGKRPMTAELALRLARYFGTTPEFWLNLQLHYDLEVASREAGERIAREVEPRNAV